MTLAQRKRKRVPDRSDEVTRDTDRYPAEDCTCSLYVISNGVSLGCEVHSLRPVWTGNPIPEEVIPDRSTE